MNKKHRQHMQKLRDEKRRERIAGAVIKHKWDRNGVRKIMRVMVGS